MCRGSSSEVKVRGGGEDDSVAMLVAMAVLGVGRAVDNDGVVVR